MTDAIGIYGGVLTYATIIAFFGTAVLVFIYVWYKGCLDWSESSKYQLFDDEKPHG